MRVWPPSLSIGPWPWSLLNVLAAAALFVAARTAWRAPDRVPGESRGLTRAWRILMLGVLAISVNGIWLPFGAVFVLTTRRWSAHSPTRHSSVA